MQKAFTILNNIGLALLRDLSRMYNAKSRRKVVDKSFTAIVCTNN
jgi:hypothetical protein